MSDVLIRNVPSEDMETIRAAAARQGVSLQHYLRNAMQAQAGYLRRQAALARAAERLADRPAVSDEQRQAVLDAVEAGHEERSARLTGGTR